MGRPYLEIIVLTLIGFTLVLLACADIVFQELINNVKNKLLVSKNWADIFRITWSGYSLSSAKQLTFSKYAKLFPSSS